MPALVYLDQNAAIGLWEWKAQNWPHALLHSDFRHCSEVVEQTVGCLSRKAGATASLTEVHLPWGIFPWSISLAVPTGKLNAASRRSSLRLGPLQFSLHVVRLMGSHFARLPRCHCPLFYPIRRGVEMERVSEALYFPVVIESGGPFSLEPQLL